MKPEFSDKSYLRDGLRLAEELADGSQTFETRIASSAGRDFNYELCGLLDEPLDLMKLIRGLRYSRARGPFGREGYTLSTDWELRFLRVLREIVGNPFRPVPFDPRWRTSDTVGLAQAIYDDRAFERMPILADALMDAGCEDEQIIGHCRGEGPHVRGCWVVDLILDKK